MRTDVLLEPLNGSGFRATSLFPARLVAEAPSQEEALNRLEELVRKELSGSVVTHLEIPLAGEEHSWKKFAGIWKNHPDADEFVKAMQENRLPACRRATVSRPAKAVAATGTVGPGDSSDCSGKQLHARDTQSRRF